MSPTEIRELRNKLGLTARQLSQELGVPTDEVFAWERGDRFPTKRSISQMGKLKPKALKTPTPAPTDSPLQSPYQASQDPRFWALTRKLLAHPELLEKALKLGDQYPDPIDE
jgi:transcriptional regulator with XRE-family HTH domain